jgi:C4-dicarboxylate-specific signal transduction histidine kinase
VTTGEDVTKIMEIPLNVEYKYIAKTMNYGMLFALGFIIFFAWIFIRRRDKRIELLEEENDELEDEISVLERAKKAHIAKKSTRVEVQKSPAKKTIAKKAPPAEETKKAPVSKKPAAKKPVTKKATTKIESKE